ncbi:MAG: helix-turn-helix domain-containing protein [Bifidobacteriaceae bacterium]|nr:helix-turn-helix domain-containing protein [Bifidobacteriaceae bacterium]
MTTTHDDRLWTAQDVADYLGIPKATLYRWRCVGSPSPEGFIIGRHLRFDPAKVRAWVHDRATADDGPRG